MSVEPAVSGRSAARTSSVLRGLIYLQAAAALMTASWDIAYVAAFYGVLGWETFRRYWGELESTSICAFLTAIVLPVAVFVVARRSGLQGRPFWSAIATSLALTAFQFFAILPAVQ